MPDPGLKRQQFLDPKKFLLSSRKYEMDVFHPRFSDPDPGVEKIFDTVSGSKF
jgi:hypothetical protein